MTGRCKLKNGAIIEDRNTIYPRRTSPYGRSLLDQADQEPTLLRGDSIVDDTHFGETTIYDTEDYETSMYGDNVFDAKNKKKSKGWFPDRLLFKR